MCDTLDEDAVFDRAIDDRIGKAPDENPPYSETHRGARQWKC